MRCKLFRIAFIAASVALCGKADAVTLDWGTATWTPGSLSNSYDVDAGSPGNDITVSISGRTSELINDPVTGLPSPDISTAQEGGQNPVQPSLNIAANFGHQSRVVTVTVNFSSNYAAGVEGVSFAIFGIDRPGAANGYIDQVRAIYGVAMDGTLVAPTITYGSSVTHTGTGLTQMLTGNNSVPRSGAGSENGNATITFSVPIKSFSFSFGNDNPASNNPLAQDFSFSDVTYSPVPEINPALACTALCLIAGIVVHRQSLRRRKLPADSGP